MSHRGRFIVLEGIDGCGKTTQLEALRDWLPDSGLLPPGAKVITTREPGGTPFGHALRDLLLHPPAGQSPCWGAELLLYLADRAQHVAERVAPSLAAGHWVLSDRYHGSTLAYQGHGRGHPLELLGALHRFAANGLQPDLTLWLDVPLAEAMARLRHRAQDRIETEGEAFLSRVYYGFRRLAEGPGWRRVNGDGDPDLVTGRCKDQILDWF